MRKAGAPTPRETKGMGVKDGRAERPRGPTKKKFRGGEKKEKGRALSNVTDHSQSKRIVPFSPANGRRAGGSQARALIRGNRRRLPLRLPRLSCVPFEQTRCLVGDGTSWKFGWGTDRVRRGGTVSPHRAMGGRSHDRSIVQKLHCLKRMNDCAWSAKTHDRNKKVSAKKGSWAQGEAFKDTILY